MANSTLCLSSMSVQKVVVSLSVYAIIFSCAQKQSLDSEFNFIINGTLQGTLVRPLYLYLPSQGLDKKIFPLIDGDKFTFKGKASHVEVAQLRFDYVVDLDNLDQPYSSTSIFIEPGLSELILTLAGDSLFPYISKIDVLKGPYNNFFFTSREKFWKQTRTTIYSDPVKVDSMQTYVYPELRKSIFKCYDSLYYQKPFKEVSAYMLNTFFEIGEDGPFSISHLTSTDVAKIESYLKDLKQIGESPEYLNIQHSINLGKGVSTEELTDFNLKSITGEIETLSEKIKGNRITVLYFWTAGCRPCREFNRKNSILYPQLKMRGVEVVSINLDESEEIWRRVTAKDRIIWPNLYAGAISKIKYAYDIKAFPTKVILDSDYKRLPLKFSDASELLTF